ncbi:hypothetical protein BIW11_06507 [Tropilaelaps mercedesae]|uniref:Uncharacterized protein n=1 Tax=Tropilaelaps mercedesae TaxID=418985 RepID=A0A1V9XXV0_9ACAR|nr:hypothetical protein BIW11_06507 [Tropilaelaps mercedesae]
MAITSSETNKNLKYANFKVKYCQESSGSLDDFGENMPENWLYGLLALLTLLTAISIAMFIAVILGAFVLNTNATEIEPKVVNQPSMFYSESLDRGLPKRKSVRLFHPRVTTDLKG